MQINEAWGLPRVSLLLTLWQRLRMLRQQLGQLSDDLRIGIGQVPGFQRILLVVVKFVFRFTFANGFPCDQPVALGADGTADADWISSLWKTVVGMVLDAPGWILEHGQHAQAVNRLRCIGSGQSRQFYQGGVDVDGFGKLPGDTARSGDARCHEDDRDTVGLLVIGMLGPRAVITEVPAMVAPEHNDRGFVEPEASGSGLHRTDPSLREPGKTH